MDDNQLDGFLRKAIPEPPLAPLGERERIWRKIESAPTGGLSWKSILRFKPLAVASVTAAIILVGTVFLHKSRRDIEIDQVLAAAIAYDLESEEVFY